MSGTATARVEVLTAEVRVLMVGSLQVTVSVYNQLDTVDADEIEPFGRVAPRDAESSRIYVVGRSRRESDAGSLVRSSHQRSVVLEHFVKKEGTKVLAAAEFRRYQHEERALREKHGQPSTMSEDLYEEWSRVSHLRDERARQALGRHSNAYYDIDAVLEADRYLTEKTVHLMHRAVKEAQEEIPTALEWGALPLIVLAGLR